MKAAQQGDVFFESCEVPAGVNPVKHDPRGFVLAEGEATGHAHVIEQVAGVEFVEKDGMFYLVNENPVTVKHEEHKPVTLPPGSWRVRRVREFDHFQEEARTVAD